jgi:Na+-driven multidrug efflux pump
MRLRSWHSVLIVLVVAAIVLLFAVPADAQCSMCRAALNGSNNTRFIRYFNIGILVLLVPPVTIFCSLFLVLRRYRGNG